jgi:hypothetical protein
MQHSNKKLEASYSQEDSWSTVTDAHMGFLTSYHCISLKNKKMDEIIRIVNEHTYRM